ncbi:MAG: class I SAM-dependent methyltransferase, partial [Gemmatimonadaceae bacterium]|nr:class I SAM-dependent methyltransferase [Gemmatimonadaceae bacterium]
MSHSVRRHLRVEIEAYDRTIRAFIPSYEEMLERAALAVAEARPRRVIDLGAGTGALAEAVLRRCEGAHVELIDADAEMLDQARERLAAFVSRVSYSARSFQGPLPACDAVVASLALHHVPTLAEKREIFAAIHATLPPGGVFINADATMPADPAARQADYETWAAHLVSCGIEEQQAWRHFEEWSGEDTYFPL